MLLCHFPEEISGKFTALGWYVPLWFHRLGSDNLFSPKTEVPWGIGMISKCYFPTGFNIINMWAAKPKFVKPWYQKLVPLIIVNYTQPSVLWETRTCCFYFTVLGSCFQHPPLPPLFSTSSNLHSTFKWTFWPHPHIGEYTCCWSDMN